MPAGAATRQRQIKSWAHGGLYHIRDAGTVLWPIRVYLYALVWFLNPIWVWSVPAISNGNQLERRRTEVSVARRFPKQDVPDMRTLAFFCTKLLY